MPDFIEQNGRYIITNVQGGTVIDLSGQDNKSVIGYPRNNGDNQKWELNEIDGGWIFQNIRSRTYLSYDDPPDDGRPLIVSERPCVFHLWPAKGHQPVYRISIPNTNKDVDLSDHGNPTPGTPIAMWGQWNPGLNQHWTFDKVE